MKTDEKYAELLSDVSIRHEENCEVKCIKPEREYPLDELDTIPLKAPEGKSTGHHKQHNTQHRKPDGTFSRGLRSMGRYPYLTQLEQYQNDRIGINRVSNNTQKSENSVLNKLHRDVIQPLYKENRISTTNPRKFTEADLMEIIRRLNTDVKRNGEPLDKDTIAKYIQHLSSFLIWAKNPDIARLKQLKRLPKHSEEKAIESLDSEDTLYLLEESQNISGWNGDVLAFTIPTFIIQGLRANELFRAELQDIDTRKWSFFIRYPKGGQAKQKRIRIHPALQPYVIRFLEARERELDKRHAESKYLFPSLTHKSLRNQPYSDNYHYHIRQILSKKTGITFDYHKLRRTSGQYLKDQGESIEVVSKHLRHSTTRVTEKYYARMRDEQAEDRISEVWSRSPIGKKLVTT
jgi:integrase